MAIITAAGAGETANGFLDISSGNFARGSKEVLLGMTAVNLSVRAQLLDERNHADLMQYVLAAGTAAVTAEGAVYLIKGIKQRNVEDILKGSLKTGVGATATAYILSLDSRIIVVAHQATILALTSAQIAKFGISDLLKGRYCMGAAKLILGVGGVIGAASYAITAYLEAQISPAIEIGDNLIEGEVESEKDKLDTYLRESKLSDKQTKFLEAHKSEIEAMYANPHKIKGDWIELGDGKSKRALEHPEMPGMVVKIPRFTFGNRRETGEEDLILNYENYKKARWMSEAYERIVIPESHLFQTSKGIITVEQKVNVVDYDSVEPSEEKDTTYFQCEQFVYKSGLCDIYIQSNTNAGFVPNTFPPKAAIFDFDCMYKRDFTRFDYKPVINHIHESPQTTGWIRATILGVGAAMQGAASTVIKKASKVNANTALHIGLGVALVADAMMFAEVDGFVDAPNLRISGISMAIAATASIAASVIPTAVSKVASWVRSWF